MITWRRARAKEKAKEKEEKAEIPGPAAAKATQMEREEKETARTEKAAKEKKRDFVSLVQETGASQRGVPIIPCRQAEGNLQFHRGLGRRVQLVLRYRRAEPKW